MLNICLECKNRIYIDKRSMLIFFVLDTKTGFMVIKEA